MGFILVYAVISYLVISVSIRLVLMPTNTDVPSLIVFSVATLQDLYHNGFENRACASTQVPQASLLLSPPLVQYQKLEEISPH